MRTPRKKETAYIVWHCSATQPTQDIGVADIDKMHRARGWDGCGYHLVIKRNGKIEAGEPLMNRGAHAEGYNEVSVAVCMVGGINQSGKTECNFTDEQWESAFIVSTFLRRMFPNAKVLGHRDLSPDVNGDGEVTSREWMKDCPTFDANKVFMTGVKPSGDVFDDDDVEELQFEP